MPEAESSPDAKPLPRLGSYQLLGQLGSGGMSNVFRAIHQESGSVVAVKVLPRTLAKNPTLLQRFLREAKSAEALDHPHIVQIFDRGFDQGRHYLVLEFVEGRDLHDRVRLNGPMGIEEAVGLIREVAEGLHYAVGRGMIHRDVKPANLLVTPEGHAKIIDLGLALQTDDEDERVTRDGTTVGTVDYMAPEQARDSRKTSDRSDQYSLGCTFFYLLTGSPPFPGGGLADKLARHFTAPIPDVRERRPEVPEALALLVQKMMAKKPERRYADYPALIAALDSLSDPARAMVSLDALIVDDDDDDEIIGLAPTLPMVGGQGGLGDSHPPTATYLTAEVIDDEDEDDLAPTPPPARAAEVSLAELAALDGDADDPLPRKVLRPSGTIPAAAPPVAPTLDAMLEKDEVVEGESGAARGGGKELSLQTWISAGVLVGLAIALVGFGVSMVVSSSKSEPTEIAVRPVPAHPPEEDSTVSAPTVPTKPKEPRPGPIRPPAPAGIDQDKTKAKAPPPVEPTRAAVVPVEPTEERVYPPEWTARLATTIPADESVAADRPRVVVRRLAEAGDEPSTASVASALGRLGDLVEFADSGPFFEDDVQVAGKSRLVRARPGFRPILKIEPTDQATIREQEAKFLLGGPRIENLVLEGIDLAVDLRDLPLPQSTLFLCRGADLTLRDCTITLYNAGSRKFTLFRLVDGARTNRLTLDRTTIRGPIRSLVELSAAKAEIVLDRTLVVGDVGPLIAIDPADKPARTLFLTRSLIATRGPLIEWSGKPGPMAIRALGTTLARIDGGPALGLLHCRGANPAEARTWLDWAGEDNHLVGWQACLTSGTEVAIRVARLGDVHQAWPGTDTTSRETPTPWGSSLLRDEVAPVDLATLAPDLRATLARIAAPHPRLRELAVEQLRRLPVPELAGGSPSMIVPGRMTPPDSARYPMPTTRVQGVGAAGGGLPTGPLRPVAPTKDEPAMAADLAFDVEAAPWNGDLGRFLAEKVTLPGCRAVIRVRGTGWHASSPVRLPDGASVAILGEWVAGSKAPMLAFFPTPGSVGQSMFDLRKGDLELAHLVLATDGSVRPRHWVRVEDGLLVIRHCWLRDRGGPDPDVGPMVSFVASGSAAIPKRAGPLASATDCPTARLLDTVIWTGGDPISAEVGRGVVLLENCLLLSGGPAVTLLPGKVARDQFAADLVLESCTIADERTAIQLGPWPGDPAGPVRPWLVSTRSCVFPKIHRDTSGALLQVDPVAFSRGVVFWQSNSDAYEIGRFLGPTGTQPAGPIPSPDMKKQWLALWGPHHARSDRGPDPYRRDHVLRFKEKDRSKVGKLTTASLELDPQVASNKSLGVRFKDLPTPPPPR